MCPNPDDPQRADDPQRLGDQRRRPPRATGRQDRHTPSERPEPEPLGEAPDEAPAHEPFDNNYAAPRGHAFYAQGRATSYGFGCLVAVMLGALAMMALLIGLAFTPAQDEFGVQPGPIGTGGGAEPTAPVVD